VTEPALGVYLLRTHHQNKWLHQLLPPACGQRLITIPRAGRIILDIQPFGCLGVNAGMRCRAGTAGREQIGKINPMK
jgi:hypothetical protein